MPRTHARGEGLVGTTLLGKLRVKRLLGEGGMGAVYEVEHLLTRHDRALKILHPELQYSPSAVERMIREAGVAGTLRSEHVVETYDVGSLSDGSIYVLMELCRGETLGQLFGRGRIDRERLVSLMCQACDGIQEAHLAGIVHRDLKPDNLFVDRRGDTGERLKILDFGISKFDPSLLSNPKTLTREGAILGTPHYMSAEQAMGRTDLDARSDLYSLGVVLYEGLTGHRPFLGPSLPQLIIQIHTGAPTPLTELAPDLDPQLAAVVEKAMCTDRNERFASAAALRQALLPFSDGASRQEPPPPDPNPELRGSEEISSPPAFVATSGDSNIVPTRGAFTRIAWSRWALLVAAAIALGLGMLTWSIASEEPPSAPELGGAGQDSNTTAAQPLTETNPAPVREAEPTFDHDRPTKFPQNAEQPVAPSGRRRRPGNPANRTERWNIDRDNPYP